MSLEKWFMKLRDNHTDALECYCFSCKRCFDVNYSPQIQTKAYEARFSCSLFWFGF